MASGTSDRMREITKVERANDSLKAFKYANFTVLLFYWALAQPCHSANVGHSLLEYFPTGHRCTKAVSRVSFILRSMQIIELVKVVRLVTCRNTPGNDGEACIWARGYDDLVRASTCRLILGGDGVDHVEKTDVQGPRHSL